MNYHFGQMFRAIGGNFTAVLSTLTTMVLTLMILGVVGLLTLNLEKTLEGLEKEIEISVFLLDRADPKALTAEIESGKFPDVAQVRFSSKEDILKQMSQDLPSVQEGLEKNPFPNTLHVRLQDPKNIETVAENIRKLDGVEDIEYGQSYVATTLRIIGSVRIAGYVLVLMLLLNSLMNILNTVRVSMFARRQEIDVMRLLGAKRSFIRAPYVLEGIFLGSISGLVSVGFLYPGYLAITSWLKEFFPAIVFTRLDWAQMLLLSLVGLGFLVGLIGSWFAANRYLGELE
ncbi:MAG: permease-like cell division protein FtsX [Deinococcaceae bacterium]